MNISLVFKVPDFLRRGHTFVDAVKSGKQAAIVASLGAVLAWLAPVLGSQINAHPWIAFFFSEAGIQAVGAVLAGGAAIVHYFGSSADRGILPAKDGGNVAGNVANASTPAAASDPAASSVASVQSEPAGVQPASDALARQDEQSLRAGG